MAILPSPTVQRVAYLFDSVACSFERSPQRSARIVTEVVDGVPREPHLQRDLLVLHPAELGQQHVPLARCESAADELMHESDEAVARSGLMRIGPDVDFV